MEHDEGLNAAVVAVLRAERAAAGLSLVEVARRAHVPLVTVQRLMACRRGLRVDTLGALCTALGVSVADVVARAAHDVDSS